MKKRILSFVIMLTMLLAFLPVNVSAIATRGTCGVSLIWTLDDSGKLTISGTGAMENYRSEGPWGTKSVKTVVIEKGVTSIGDYAFNDCENITNITIPDGLTEIGIMAFADCHNLKNIDLPDSITYIGSQAFLSCWTLTTVVLPKDLTSIDGLFSECIALTNVVIPDGVTFIGGWTFLNCPLTGIIIPNSITEIGESAFNGCRLTNITIPNAVTEIGENAFADCYALKDVYYNGTETEWKAIHIGHHNDYLTNANIHYSSNSPVGSTVVVPMSASSVELIQAESGEEYNIQLKVQGQTEPCTWEYRRGVKPAGLTINADGTITGTPTTSGYYKSMYIKYTDSTGKSSTKKFGLKIAPKGVHVEHIGESIFTYDGNPHGLTFKCREVQELELTTKYGDSTDEPVNAGSYYMDVSSKDWNYYVIRDKNYFLTINHE